jgi:hypothetical protein
MLLGHGGEGASALLKRDFGTDDARVAGHLGDGPTSRDDEAERR